MVEHVDIGNLARRAIERCERLARYSEDPPRVRRTFLSPPTRAVHHTVGQWMAEAGMTVRVDGMGNLIGAFEGAPTAGKPESLPVPFRVLIGSHLDSVPNAGKFDGILGVMLGLAVVEAVRERRLAIGIDVAGFSEEEGVRFATPYLGSKAFVGQVDEAMLGLRDADGVSVAEAVRAFGLDPTLRSAPPEYVAYLEAHIEQGPVLESLDRPIGIVTGISGQSRRRVRFVGRAAHAGTTPMNLRRDALAAAAEWVGRVESSAIGVSGAVATVGSLQVSPGASNVVAGDVTASLDVRHVEDATRVRLCEEILGSGASIARARGLVLEVVGGSEHATVPMDSRLQQTLMRAAGADVPTLASGGGHDAAILAPVIPSCMLFVRSPGGVSHHPDEAVLPGDVERALEVMVRFVERLAADYNPPAAQPRKD